MVRLLIWAIIISILGISCNNEEQVYIGKKIEIDYSNVKKIKDQSWITIDNWKFVHLRNRKEAAKTNFSLPTTTVLFDSLQTGKTFQKQVNPKTIPIYLLKYLKTINTEVLSGNNTPHYKILNPALASLEGKIQIERNDSTALRIQTSKGYPAKIILLEQ